MAELSLFVYRPQAGWLSDCDPRLKLVALAGLSVCSLGAGWASLGLVTLIAGITWYRLIASAAAFWRHTRLFLVLLVLVVVIRAVVIPGQVLLQLGPLCFTAEGLASGLLVALRLLLVVVLAMILTTSTSSGRIRSAVAWFLKPVPVIDERQVATMIGLLVRFIPVIFQQMRETAAAQQARAVAASKNPLRRTIKLALPVIRRVFLTADRLTLAMEARCFTIERPLMPLEGGKNDRMLAAGATFLCLVLLLM